MCKHPMRDLLLWVGLVALLVANAVSAFAQQPSNPTQERAKYTIGSLVIDNINCTEQNVLLVGQVSALQKELAELKAKHTPAAPQAPKQ